MRVIIRQIGNLRGIVIPEAFLAHLDLEGHVDVSIEGDALVIRKPAARDRRGWRAASRRIADSGDDRLVLGEFDNRSVNVTW